MMTLDGLHHLLLIDAHGTFTAAARHAHLSQPALTASIQRLESSVGATLLDRGRRGASLTQAGRALLPYARLALSAVADGGAAVTAVTGLTAGAVVLGGGATACTWLLPTPLAHFRAEFPGVSVSLREASTDESLRAVAAAEVALAVVTVGPPPPRGVVVEPLCTDTLTVVAAAATPDDAPWIALGRGTPTRRLLDMHAPHAEIAAELSSAGAVVALAEAGLGRALVSTSATRLALSEGRLRLVPTLWAPVSRHLGLAHRGLDRLDPAARAVRERLHRDLGPPPTA